MPIKEDIEKLQSLNERLKIQNAKSKTLYLPM